MEDFLLGFLTCALLSVAALSLYIKHKNREAERQRQMMAVEILRNLNVSKLRKLLGDMELPSWITYSDFERAEWLSQLLGQIWPYVDNAVSAVGRAKLEPKLKERRAAWMADISIEHFTLGSRPPMVTGVKLYRNATPGVAEGAFMDIDMLWSGNQDISLIVKPLPHFLNLVLGIGEFINIQVGVERVIMSGRMRLYLKPLLDSLPIIGAVQVAFADMPRFRFDLRLFGGDATSLPFLEDWLQNTFCSALEHITLPNRWSKEVVQGVLAQVERPVGILTVRLIEAVNIPKTDLCSESDPYVVLYVRSHRRLQSTIKNNRRHPVWNETFRLLVHQPDEDTLTCLLYDYDIIRADALIGRVDWPVSQIRPGEERDLWLEVHEPRCSPRMQPGSPDGRPGSPPGQPVVSRKRSVPKRVVTLQKAKQLQDKLLRGDKPCRLHLKVTYKAIEDTTLQAATARDSEASEAEDENAASAVARDMSDQQPGQASSSVSQPPPHQAWAHQAPAAQKVPNEAISDHAAGPYGPDQASSSASKAMPDQAAPHQAPAAQRAPDLATADCTAGQIAPDQDARMAPHQPTAPVKALEARAASVETAEHGRLGASSAWTARTSADVSAGRQPDNLGQAEHTATSSSSSIDGESMRGRQSYTRQQPQRPPMRHRQEPAPADVHELQQILSGGILVVQVKSVTDLKGKPWWKGGFRKELQVRVTVCGHSKESGRVTPPTLALFNTPQRTIMLRVELDFELAAEEAHRAGETVHVEIWDVFLKPEFQGYVDVLLSDVVAQRRLRGEWPLSEVSQGAVSLDLSWTGTLQRGRIAHSQQQAF